MNSILGLFSGMMSSFDDTLWKIALLVAIVVTIGYCLRFKNGKIIIFSVLSVSFIVATSYCAVQLNYYYNEKGGIYGQLVSLYKPNEVVITNNVSYSFKNINLTADGDLYSAKITSTEVLDLVLDENATYGVYVNGIPCEYVNITQDYVIAKYRYTFYDDEFNVLMDDVLSFKFAFYTNSTYLTVSTSGGSKAVDYWNNFFNRNVFDVTIDNKGYSYSKDISFGTGDISEYSVINYYIDNELYLKQVYKNGNIVKLPSDSNYLWSFENGEKVGSDFVITESISLYACPFTLTFDCNGSSDEFESRLLYYNDTYGELPTPTREGYAFDGWYTSITGGSKVNGITTMGNTNTIIYARWSKMTYIIKFDANGGSGTMSDEIFTYDEIKALRTNAFIRDGYKFVGWSTSKNGQIIYKDGDVISNLTSESKVITLYAVWSNSYYTANVYTMDADGSYPSGYTSLIIPSAVGVVDITEDAITSNYVVEDAIVLDKITDIDGNEITSVDVAEDNTTVVKFYYKRIQHILSINANGGSFLYLNKWTFDNNYTSAYTNRYYGQEYGALPTVTRYGYKFIGWFTSIAGGTTVSLHKSMGIEDVTIYAQWELIENFDNSSVNPATFNIDLDKLSTYTNSYIENAQGTTSNINVDKIIQVSYCNNNILKLIGIVNKDGTIYFVTYSMSYIDKSQSITEIIEAQQDFELTLTSYYSIDADLIMYSLYFYDGEYATISLINRENVDSGYKLNFAVHVYSNNICYEYSLSFISTRILTTPQIIEKLTSIFEGNVYNNEEVEISRISEMLYLKINNIYILNY